MNEESQNGTLEFTEPSQALTLGSKEAEQLIQEKVEEKVNSEIAHDKATLFTVFGIFASILAFTSVEIQILKATCSFGKILGLSFIMLSSLLTFVLILDYIGRGWRQNSWDQIKSFPWHLLIIVSVLFIAGVFSSYYGNEQLCKENTIYARYEKDFIEKQVFLESLIQSDLKKIEGKILKNS